MWGWWCGVASSGSHDVIRIGSNDLSIITTIMKRAALKTTLSSQCCPLMPTAITQSARPALLPDLLPNHSRSSAGRQQSFVWISREREMSVWGSELSVLPNWQPWPLYVYQWVVKEARVQIAYFPALLWEHIAASHVALLLLTLRQEFPLLAKGRSKREREGKKCGGSQWCELNKRNGGVMVKGWLMSL